MPNNQSQKRSQSRSQSQSKNGGRGRKKRTMKKDRRVKKSRKVMMRGGANIVTWEKLEEKLNRMNAKNAFTQAMGRTDDDFDAFKTDTMKNTKNLDTVDLSRIKNVISTKPQYSFAVKAIDELIAESN